MATVGGVMVAAQRSAVQRSAVQRTGGPAVRLVAAGRTGSSAIHSQGMAPCPPLPTVSFGAISLDAAAVAAVSCARGTGAFSLRSAPLSLVSHTAAAPAGTEVPVRQWGRYGRRDRSGGSAQGLSAHMGCIGAQRSTSGGLSGLSLHDGERTVHHARHLPCLLGPLI